MTNYFYGEWCNVVVSGERCGRNFIARRCKLISSPIRVFNTSQIIFSWRESFDVGIEIASWAFSIRFPSIV